MRNVAGVVSSHAYGPGKDFRFRTKYDPLKGFKGGDMIRRTFSKDPSRYHEEKGPLGSGWLEANVIKSPGLCEHQCASPWPCSARSLRNLLPEMSFPFRVVPSARIFVNSCLALWA